MTAFLNHIGGLTGWGLLAVAPNPTPPHPTQLNFGISYQSMHTLSGKRMFLLYKLMIFLIGMKGIKIIYIVQNVIIFDGL